MKIKYKTAEELDKLSVEELCQATRELFGLSASEKRRQQENCKKHDY